MRCSKKQENLTSVEISQLSQVGFVQTNEIVYNLNCISLTVLVGSINKN